MINLFKKIDSLIGTPLCYLLGLTNKEKSIPETINNILIIKLVAMGDMIVLLPSIHAIRKKYPNAKITLLTTPAMMQVVADFSDIDEVIPFRIPADAGIFGFWQFIKKINNLKFDIAIDFEQYYRLTGLIMWFARIPHRIGFDISGQGRNTMLTTKVKYSDTLHEVENFGRLAAALGATAPTQLISPVFKSSVADVQYIKDLLPTEKIIVIHPGTSATAKSRRWPVERFAELADNLRNPGYTIVFSGADEEREIVNKILSHTSQKHISLVGKTTLSQLLELFKYASLVISLDTGPMHLAASSKTPTLGLFGANTPQKWGPYGSQHRAIYHGLNLPCTQQQYGRVCTHPQGYHMNDITVAEVEKMAREMLAKNSD